MKLGLHVLVAGNNPEKESLALTHDHFTQLQFDSVAHAISFLQTAKESGCQGVCLVWPEGMSEPYWYNPKGQTGEDCTLHTGESGPQWVGCWSYWYICETCLLTKEWVG